MPLMVLDCDGVLLAYNRAYPAAWKAAFGEDLVLKYPGLHHAYNEYDCLFTSAEQKLTFYQHFIGELWATMPLLDGVKPACDTLVAMGYELVCVTTMPPEFYEFRVANFQLHDLPISRTFAVGRDRNLPAYNAKRDILLQLNPVAFVDDYAANFMDLDGVAMHKALIYREQSDSPNTTLLHLADSIHTSLAAFVEFWENRTSNAGFQ